MNNISDEARERIRQGAINCCNMLRERRLENYLKSPKYCNFCGNMLQYRKRKNDYCNHSCAKKYCDEKYGKISGRRKKEQICIVCNTKIENRNAIKFCSQECNWQYKKNITLSKFREGKISSESRTILRRILVELFGYRCQVCKNEIWNNKPIPLEIEHIDGHSENNFPENLQLICPNCHAQTDTYKGKNKGNGRHSRKIRYKEGKSY